MPLCALLHILGRAGLSTFVMPSLKEARAFGRIAVADYLFALLFSFPLFAITWALFAPGHLYYCWDDAISWRPPFIHTWANSADGKLVDRYIAPAWVVYLVWFAFIAGVFLLPVVFAWRRERRIGAHDIA